MNFRERVRQILTAANAFMEGVFYPQGASCQVCGEYRKVDFNYALCEECMNAMDDLRVPAAACDKCLFPVRHGSACSMCTSRRMKSIDKSYAPFCYHKQVRMIEFDNCSQEQDIVFDIHYIYKRNIYAGVYSQAARIIIFCFCI